MKIVSLPNGTWIELDDVLNPFTHNKELDMVYEIMCNCGHPLKLHSWVVWWGTNRISTSQCTACEIVYDEYDKHGRFTCPHFTPTDDLK
jgi:hypothetical protein